MAAWFRPRMLRTGRSLRNRNNSGDDVLQLDFTKDLPVTVKEILSNIVKRDGLTINRRLKYLGAFANVCEKITDHESFGYSAEEVFRCLRIPLLHDAREVRAAGLRAMRYFLQDEKSIDAFLRANGHHLVCRSLDIILDNHIERIQAIRLMRKCLNVSCKKFPLAFVKCLVAVANDGAEERDGLFRACLATLSELVILNMSLCVESGVIGSLLRCILTCYQPRINEALVGTVLYLLNQPETRCYVRMGVDLEQVLAPYTDCHFRQPTDSADYSGDDKDSSFVASRLALLSILRSWPGMIRLCKSDGSGLKSLINVMYLPNAEIRKGVIDMLLELFRLPVPDWSDDFTVALAAADSVFSRDDWRLYEGFVAKEGYDILAYVSDNRTNLIENYLALLLLAFIHNGILEALVEVILTSDSFLSVRTTFFLGELLHLANRFLPHECSHHSYCLPTLLAVAASFKTSAKQRHIASATVTYLNRVHSLKKRGPVPSSLFLDQLIQFSPKANDFNRHNNKIGRAKLLSCLRKETDDFLSQSIKCSQVTNTSKDFHDWDWPLIGAILKLGGEQLRKLNDHNQKQFLRKLIHFFKPTSKLFSKVEQGKERFRVISIVGCNLMDFLVESNEDEATKCLEEFLMDFGLCLGQITAERSPSDAIFSPNRILSSHCQDYFLFIGRLSQSNRGRKALERTSVYQYLIDLVSITSHDCYVKLIVSSLDYTRDGLPRIIMTKILTATSESARLYSTRFLRVLVRLQFVDFHKWGVELLVSQLYDKSRAVSLAALDVLDEACELQSNLEALVHMRPSLLHLGDRGLLLLIRFLSIPAGFKFLSDTNFVTNELERWKRAFNVKYVRLLEDELNESLTRHQRGKDGSYGRRTSQKHLIRDVFVPHHLYAQLSQHKSGLDLLREQKCISQAIEKVRRHKLETSDEILQLKAVLWALGHTGTSEEGVMLLNNEHILPDIVKLAEECQIYAVRGTCFYVLGLLATTRVGSDLLEQLGWEALRRSRHEQWPSVDEPDLLGLEDCVSSVDSLSSQLAELEADDTCSGTLQRLDECMDGDGLEEMEEVSNCSRHGTHFVLGEYDEIGGGDDVTDESNDSPKPTSKINWSPVPKDEVVVLRRPLSRAAENAPSPLTRRIEPHHSGGFQKWSNTLPLMRHRPCTPQEVSVCASVGGAPVTNMIGNCNSRQRSRSVSQHPTVFETVVEAWERRNKLSSLEVGGSVQSSPRGSTRMRPKLKITVKERTRSRSFTEAGTYNDKVNISLGHGEKHLRSSSDVEIGLKGGGVGGGGVGGVGVGSGITTGNIIVVNGLRCESRDSGSVSQNTLLKDRRCDSNESSRTSTSKSRSDSCTDSTSGFSSCESGNVRASESRAGGGMLSDPPPQLLSPISSSGSINTMSGRTVHHSDVTRKMVNLRNTPVVLNRVSTSRNFASVHNAFARPTSLCDMHPHETSFVYTTTRDAQGYATLRSLQQRRRGFSTCVPPDPQMLTSNLRAAKTRSLDSRLELPRLLNSYESVSSLGVLYFDRQPSATFSTNTSHAIKLDCEDKRFVALCLPVDIAMIFNEDSSEYCSQFSFSMEINQNGSSASANMRPYGDINSEMNDTLDDGLSLHVPDSCLGCFTLRCRIIIESDSADETHHPKIEVSSMLSKETLDKPQTNSSETSVATTPGSTSSVGSCDTGNKGLDVESFAGKSLVRKEVIRFIVNLSSSVATKSAEQGLLNMKQKFPTAFQDLCLYTEVCLMMAQYNFRLSARRFIQELFLDLTFKKLYDEAFQILELVELGSVD